VNIAAIAGGSIGVLVLIAAVVVALVFVGVIPSTNPKIKEI
jgi:hypothetical protein